MVSGFNNIADTFPTPSFVEPEVLFQTPKKNICDKLKAVRKPIAIWLLFLTLVSGGVTVVATRSLEYYSAPGIVRLASKRRVADAQLQNPLRAKAKQPAFFQFVLRPVRWVESLLCFSLFERPPPMLS